MAESQQKSKTNISHKCNFNFTAFLWCIIKSQTTPEVH